MAIEYALKYQANLKGLIISNMMASIPAYNVYADRVLMPAMDQTVLAEIKRLEAEHEAYSKVVQIALDRPHDSWQLPPHAPANRGPEDKAESLLMEARSSLEKTPGRPKPRSLP